MVCAENTDLRTLETVLQIRDLRPDVRVVADLDNPAWPTRSRRSLSSVRVLDVAALFAPAVVEACIGSPRAAMISSATPSFVAAEVIAPARRDAARDLRQSRADRRGHGGERELIACPGRDQPVSRGDRVTVLGTRAELDAAGPARGPRAQKGESRLRRSVRPPRRAS